MNEQDGAGCAWMFMKLVIGVGLAMFAMGVLFAFIAKAIF